MLMLAIMLVLLVLMLALAIVPLRDMRLRSLIHHPCLQKKDKFSQDKGSQKSQLTRERILHP